MRPIIDGIPMNAPDPFPGDWEEPREGPLRGLFNRVLQLLARISPGAQTLRVMLHRARGVTIGKGVWIGYDVVLDTARPDLIVIEDGASISMRAVIVGHFKEFRGVRIEQEAFIGPGAIILPKVVVGRGAVVKAGSVVSQSIPPMIVVQGNPAVPVARCGIPLRQDVSMKTFAANLQPLNAWAQNRQAGPDGVSLKVVASA
jgi:serine acetyltransferase